MQRKTPPQRDYSRYHHSTKAPKKIMDIARPEDFPVLGRTMSPHASQYFEAKGISARTPVKKKFSWRKAIKRAILVVLAAGLITGGWVGFKFYKNFGGFAGIWGLFHSTKLKGEDVGRVNILLAGDSADDPGHSGADLTDSIMLISIDTKNNTAFTLSIPRDLWVNFGTSGCPYGDVGKINAVYECGQSLRFSQSGFAAGGMGLLEKVVSQDFGVTIDYYALTNYSAFRDSVNAVGGIEVTINSPDGRLYDPNKDWSTGGPLVDLSNGVHHLDGEQALDLARARGDPSPWGYAIGYEQSDFTRTANQRMMLSALEKKALSAGVLANPVKLGNLFDSVGKNVKTDFTLSNIHRLYDLSKKSNGKIQSLALSNSGTNALLQSYSSDDGQSALIPAAGLDNFTAIQTYVDQLTVVPTPTKSQ